MQRFDFGLKTADGVTLAVSRWIPDTPPKARVLLAHGFTAHRHKDEIQNLSSVFGGTDLTIHDFRGHGESEGVTTVGKDESQDVQAVAEYLIENPASPRANSSPATSPPLRNDSIPPPGPPPSDSSTPDLSAPLILVGISMGAVAGVNFLVSSPLAHHFNGLLLIGCPAYWRARPGKSALVMAFLTRTALGRKVARKRMGVNIAKKITLPEAPASIINRVNIPVGIIGGKQDLLLGEQAHQSLYDAANQPKKLTLIDGAGHAIGPPAIQACRETLNWLLAPV